MHEIITTGLGRKIFEVSTQRKQSSQHGSHVFYGCFIAHSYCSMYCKITTFKIVRRKIILTSRETRQKK